MRSLTEFREGQLHFTEHGEFLVQMPPDSICSCGHDKEFHGHYMGVVGLGRCGGCMGKCNCREFNPVEAFVVFDPFGQERSDHVSLL